MHDYANKYVSISEISAYMICPRLGYFRRRRPGGAPTPEIVRAASFREISRSLAGVIVAEDPGAALRSHIEVACVDAGTVYGLPVDEIIDEAMAAVRDIIAGLGIESARIGRDRLLAILDPHERAQVIYSDRLRISGTVDRIALLDGARLPVVVTASRPPEHGIFASDRVRLAASAMLIEEKTGGAVERGIVEYVSGWRVREAEVRKADRMAVLSARNRIVQMGSAMPDAKRGAWCPACRHSDSCDVRPSFISSLFRPMPLDISGLSRNGTHK